MPKRTRPSKKVTKKQTRVFRPRTEKRKKPMKSFRPRNTNDA